MDEASTYRVKLNVFEGPLDLLLHLIRKNQVDIYDIPISEITQQYLDTLKLMRSLNLDLAGEFVVMAATLIHIKSKMLLPAPAGTAEEREEEDPRTELVNRILEYEKFKEAAQLLEDRNLLERNVFIRKIIDGGEENEEIELNLFELVEAFQRVVKSASQEWIHEVTLERIRIEEKITEVLDRLAEVDGEIGFEGLFQIEPTREAIIVTFLAVLELIRMRMIKIYQRKPFGPIKIRKI